MQKAMDIGEMNAKPKRRTGVVTIATLAALLGTIVGLGVGIGIGAAIWKNSDSENSSFALSDACDASAEHDDSLITYILTVGDYTLQPGGDFINVYVPNESLPSSMPYVINDVKNGALYQNLLNTTMFLEDWSLLSSQVNESNGEFAMPGYAAARQCYQDYELAAESSPVPPNAMVVRHDDDKVERLVHVFSVVSEPDGFVFRLLPVVDADPKILPEGQCHSYQNLSTPHFHHVSTCLEYDANWVVGQNGTQGSGLTAFIKLGPLIDAGVAAVGADALAGAGADAAVGAGADAAAGAGVDAAADAGADVASDAGYDGDDIVSNASSDGASDRADTIIGNENQQGGGGPGVGTAAAVGGGTIAVVDAVTASGPTAASTDLPGRG